MKIAVLSDFHFGFGRGTELEEDSFENASEAIERALDSDLILILGDIFDSRFPKTTTWAKAIKVLVKALLRKSGGLKLLQSSKKLKEISKITLGHLPLLALHGNHERRGVGEINAVEAMENAGILIYLHCQHLVFEKDGKKVAIHGMSWVPERFAKSVLDRWAPKPVPGCFNILLFHQNIHPFVFTPLEPPSLDLSNLPKGFDLMINGHVHEHIEERINGSLFLIPGSTLITQFVEGEAGAEKGLYQITLDKELKVDFLSLKTNRPFFYREIKIKERAGEQLKAEIDHILQAEFVKPPLIKLKIVGREEEISDRELREIERRYSGRAIIRFVKELETPEMTKKMELLKALRERRVSIEERGLQLLKKNLDQLSFGYTFDYDRIFGLLSEGEVEKALKILGGEQSTLNGELRKWTR